VAPVGEMIDTEAATLGLTLNKNKCEHVFNPGQIQEQIAFANFMSELVNNMLLLGSPVTPGPKVKTSLPVREVNWGFIVLSCWHHQPFWHRLQALLNCMLKFYRHQRPSF